MASPGGFHIGFSTTNKIGSRIIRWASRSKVSHVFVSFPVMGDRLVFQANSKGVAMEWWSRFKKKNTIVAQYELVNGGDKWTGWRGALATSQLFPLLHSSYDFKAILGFVWVLIGKWFGRRWKNPLAQRSAYFCSELGLLWLQAAQVANVKGYDSESAWPEDVLQWCREAAPTDLLPVPEDD
jgi:hypothetical protein